MIIFGLHSVHQFVAEEQCSYCSASVPFESTVDAFCRGVNCSDGVSLSHKLFRCAASMQVCPTTTTTTSWFCLCCQRRTSNMAPQALFIFKARTTFKTIMPFLWDIATKITTRISL
ncbi:unnamed protein product [Camellia sinensis]